MSYHGGHGSIESQSISSGGGDVVGQVGDDLGAFAAEQRTRIERRRVAGYDLEAAGVSLRNIFQRRQRTLVALDRDDAFGAQREQRARQSAGTGADLDDGGVFQRPRGARDARGEVEVEQKILSERFARRQRVLLDDVAQRRKVVDRAHAGCAVAAIRAARRNAAIRLDGLARPGAGDVECGAVVRRGADERQAQRDVDRVVERQRLGRDQRLIVIPCRSRSRRFCARLHGTWCPRAAGPSRRNRRARSVSMAGAMMVCSSMPSEPSSPAWGLRPDTARRGRGDREAGLQVRRRRSGRCSRSVRSTTARWRRAATDGSSPAPTASAGDHSSITGCGVLPSRRRKFGEKFGVAGMPEPGAVQHALCNRVGDDSRRPSGDHVADGVTNRADRGMRRCCASGCPGCAVAAWPVATTGKASGNVATASSARTSFSLTSKPRSAARLPRKSRSPSQIECRKFQLVPPQPRSDRDIRPDAGRFAQCQRKRLYHARQRYSIIAALRTSSRYALDFFSNFSANIFSRISRFFGVSTVVGLRAAERHHLHALLRHFRRR